MNMRKLSINKACVLLGTLLLLAVGAVCTAVHLLTQNITAVRCVFLFSLFVLLCVICFVALIRRKLVRFSDAFCGQMDDMLSENMQPKQTVEEENLFYKINYRLGRLYEVMQENKNSIAKERADLQELISDISHQVKTPIANLKMINNTLLEKEVPPQKQKEFLTAQASQLDKLDFLMQAMIKTSRLETGVISLEQKQQPVYHLLLFHNQLVLVHFVEISLIEYNLLFHYFLRLLFAVVYQSDPFHLVGCFQFLRYPCRLHQLWHQFVHPLFCLLLDLDQMSLVIFHQKDLICRSVVFFQVSFPHQSVFPDVPLRLC